MEIIIFGIWGLEEHMDLFHYFLASNHIISKIIYLLNDSQISHILRVIFGIR